MTACVNIDMGKQVIVSSEPELPVGAKFHEGVAAKWAQGYAGGSFGRRLARFRGLLDGNVLTGTNWLDLGCGSGVLTIELLDRGAIVVAVDGSPAMLSAAQANVSTEHANAVTWLQCDVQTLPQLADSTFDGLLCSSVFEYLERPQAALAEAERLLRPGGKLILSLPPKRSIVRTLQKFVRKIAQLFGGNKFAYLAVSKFEVEPNHLRDWLDATGFVLDHVTKFDPLLPRGLLRFLSPALLIAEAHKKSDQ